MTDSDTFKRRLKTHFVIVFTHTLTVLPPSDCQHLRLWLLTLCPLICIFIIRNLVADPVCARGGSRWGVWGLALSREIIGILSLEMLQFGAFSHAFEQSLNDQHYTWLLLIFEHTLCIAWLSVLVCHVIDWRLSFLLTTDGRALFSGDVWPTV